MGSVASGPRAWHECVTPVLQYDPVKTLPPLDVEHVALVVSVFHRTGTATSYVEYARWACRELALDTSGTRTE